MYIEGYFWINAGNELVSFQGMAYYLHFKGQTNY